MRLRPLDLLALGFAQRVHREMGAQALHPVVVEDLPGLFAVGQARELVVRRIAQLDDLDAEGFHVLEQPGELPFDDPLAMRIRLAADRQTERVRVSPAARRGRQEPCDSGIGCGLLEEFSPRHCTHRALLYVPGAEDG